MKRLSNFSIKNDDNAAVSDVIGKYGDMNESELMEELLKVASKAKADGTLNEQTLKNFEKVVVPYLNESQKEKLSKLISVISLND